MVNKLVWPIYMAIFAHEADKHARARVRSNYDKR